jgi:hypothetical protein
VNARIVATSANVLEAAQNFADVQVSAITGTATVLGENLRSLSETIAKTVESIKENIESLTGTAEAE